MNLGPVLGICGVGFATGIMASLVPMFMGMTYKMHEPNRRVVVTHERMYFGDEKEVVKSQAEISSFSLNSQQDVGESDIEFVRASLTPVEDSSSFDEIVTTLPSKFSEEVQVIQRKVGSIWDDLEVTSTLELVTSNSFVTTEPDSSLWSELEQVE